MEQYTQNSKSFYVILESDIILNLNITDRAMRIYAIISNYSNNKDGYCYLPHTELIKIAKISKKQFYRCLKNLVDNNYVSRIKKNNRIYLMPVINKTIALRSYQNNAPVELLNYDWLNER